MQVKQLFITEILDCKTLVQYYYFVKLKIIEYYFVKLKIIASLRLPDIQWRAEVWWCRGRLLDSMPLYKILVLSSGVWWSLLLDIHCLWRHNTTSYSRLQTTFWRGLLPQYAYYSTHTLLNSCCTIRGGLNGREASGNMVTARSPKRLAQLKLSMFHYA